MVTRPSFLPRKLSATQQLIQRQQAKVPGVAKQIQRAPNRTALVLWSWELGKTVGLMFEFYDRLSLEQQVEFRK